MLLALRESDPAITALNPSAPAEDILVIYRSDSSGTTDNFQQYLQTAGGGTWTKGVGKTFNGGVGTGAQGNEGNLGGRQEHRGRHLLQRVVPLPSPKARPHARGH